MNKKVLAGAISLTLLGVAPFADAMTVYEGEDSSFSIGGFVKLSAMWTDFSDTQSSTQAGNNLIDTMYYAPQIPTGGKAASNAPSDLDTSARESRINFKATKKVGDHSVVGYLEFDFMPNGDGGGNEVYTNSYSPRLRHAFLNYDKWTFGQTWSTYMDLGALPESVDFLAASESVPFVRQPMVRYTNGNFQIAVENPESINESGSTDNNELPDLIANYAVKGDWGHFRVNGVVRELSTYNAATGADDSETGYGVGVSGMFKIGKDDLKYSVNYGEGSARYSGLNGAKDTTLNTQGDLETTEVTNYYAAYRHWWSEKWRSSLIYSAMSADYDTFANSSTRVDSIESLAVNLMYSPVPGVTFGGMYITAEREVENGDKGDMDRVQFSFTYSF